MRTLALTSPHMTGKDVGEAQFIMAGHNVFKQDYMRGGAIDQDCGPETGRAFIRAKYWCGYPDADQKPTYGIYLHGYLTGKIKLTKELQTNRDTRLKQTTQKPLSQKALERAYQDLGMKEHPPNSNRCPISTRWGIIGAWCDMAVSEWYIDAGSKAFTLHNDWAYVPFMLNAALEGTRGLALVRPMELQPGYVTTYDWDRDGIADHTGLFVKWLNQKAGTFLAIEGNTAVGNDSNGGQVEERDRKLSQVAITHGGWPGLIHVGR